MSTDEEPLLRADGLEKHFYQKDSFFSSLFQSPDRIHAVDGIDFAIEESDIMGVIGESGCGKSTLLNVMMGIHDSTGGDFYYRGANVTEFGRKDWKDYYRDVQLIFQDPFNSFDPKMTIRQSLYEPLSVHGMGDKAERAREALETAELMPAEKYLDKYPDQLSGGELQRVSIARALILEPKVILADEPVSMLDVSTQASILTLLADLAADLDIGMIYISHDLSTVSYICDWINVMYLGRFVESAPTKTLLQDPKHPYTQALINAIPIPDPYHDRDRVGIDGNAPSPINLGDGCRFADRCPERMDVCEETPYSVEAPHGGEVACHLYYDHEQYRQQTQQPVAND